MMNLALTYDDIQLVPSYSEVYSRKSISLETQVSKNYKIDIPLVASPMDTVCGYEMAMSFMKVGGVGCVHRFMSVEEQTHLVKKIFSARTKGGYSGDSPIMAAVGANGDYLQRSSELIAAGVDIILIDVAHGHHKNVKEAIANIKAISSEIDVIAGNIATREAALDLESWGADGLRVGIGGGCFTPNMKVFTSDGEKNIIDIKIGDSVYTHTGSLKKVINKFEYDKDEEILVINGIETTKNHEFYVVEKKYLNFISDENIGDFAKWVSAEDLNDSYLLIEL